MAGRLPRSLAAADTLQVDVQSSAVFTLLTATEASYYQPTAAGSDLGTSDRSCPGTPVTIDTSKAHANLSPPSRFT